MKRNYQIIAVDFDGTLCFSKWPDCGEPNQALINYLKNGNLMAISSSSGPAESAKIYLMLSLGVRNTDLNSMQSMTTFRKLWITMVVIAGRLPATGILMTEICKYLQIQTSLKQDETSLIKVSSCIGNAILQLIITLPSNGFQI